MEWKKVDFLVIGSGIAGLSYALKVADFGSVLIITKSDRDESNTKYAQGGIAAVISANDSFEKHIADTLVSGDGLCDESAVRMVVTEAPDRIRELISWGTKFDLNEQGAYDLGKEGGHSEPRILHHKDTTGFEIEQSLIERVQNHPNIEVHDHYFALEILTEHQLGHYVNSSTPEITCFGVYALNLLTGKTEAILARITLIATGGAGNVYASTTNPRIATGDGVAMVYRAKGRVEHMEFMQFHPTALYQPGVQPSFLITEALRGFGAILRNQDKVAFMQSYDERADLAPRDIVARAIDHELKTRGDDFVWLDCTHLDAKALKEHFPNIYAHCLQLGIDITRDFIPVVPSCHYMCGGIKVDMHARSSITNLLAAGECSSTGLHGGNRLASNSLLEALVYAHRAAETALHSFQSISFCETIPAWDIKGTADPEEMVLITQNLKELQLIMSNYVGIVRSNVRLQRALDRLQILHRETENMYRRTTLSQPLCELRNLILIGYLIIKAARQRKESRGLHFSIDYPRL
ncbi:MAG: L-aspartate oxidase [Bacteroidia bacterium]|jgi:L-aspartate oxidase